MLTLLQDIKELTKPNMQMNFEVVLLLDNVPPCRSTRQLIVVQYIRLLESDMGYLVVYAFDIVKIKDNIYITS